MNLQKILSNRTYYRNRLKIILSYLNLKGKSILDLGCGEMILFDLVKDEVTSYIGIDNCIISDKPQCIHGNILDEHFLKEYSADFVFLLGVLDHLNLDEKERILNIGRNRLSEAIIISQRNPKSLLNFFYPKSAPVVNIEEQFNNYPIKKIHLLKFPFSQQVIDLTRNNNWIKNLCTEIVYVISKR